MRAKTAFGHADIEEVIPGLRVVEMHDIIILLPILHWLESMRFHAFSLCPGSI